MRGLFLAAGTVALLLGLIGIFLPLLPTTPFVLLAAACYARGSRRFYDWLLAQRTFGPIVHEWQQHRSIPYRTKITAIVLMSLTLATSIVFFVKPVWRRPRDLALPRAVARPSALSAVRACAGRLACR
jgi:uncharacterized protein